MVAIRKSAPTIELLHFPVLVSGRRHLSSHTDYVNQNKHMSQPK